MHLVAMSVSTIGISRCSRHSRGHGRPGSTDDLYHESATFGESSRTSFQHRCLANAKFRVHILVLSFVPRVGYFWRIIQDFVPALTFGQRQIWRWLVLNTQPNPFAWQLSSAACAFGSTHSSPTPPTRHHKTVAPRTWELKTSRHSNATL